MRSRNWVLLFSVLLLVGLALSGCQSLSEPAVPEAEPTVAPTEVPPAERTDAQTIEPTAAPAEEPVTETEAESDIVVMVGDVSFTMSDLQSLEQVTIETTYKEALKEYSGVRILDLLEAAEAIGESLTLVANDGYEVEVPVTSLTEECLLAYMDDGGLLAVLPDTSTSAWVKGVVQVLCAGEATAEPGEEVVVLVVNYQNLSASDLQALEWVEIETVYTDVLTQFAGVRLVDVLELASAEGATLTLIAADGYEAEVPTASLTNDCILVSQDDGGFKAVLPEVPTSAWVKDLVEIRCEGTPADAELPGTVVTDALDRTVEFAQLPTHIVVPGKGSWMVGHPLYLFPQARERVLAMEARKGSVSNFLSSIVPGFDDLPHLDQDASPEQIAPLNPDAIVMKSYMAEKLGAPLEELGFPVIYVELETPDQFFDDVATIGQMFGNEDRVQEITSFYQGKMDVIEQGLQGADQAVKPRVLVIQTTASGEEMAFSIPPASWMQTIQVEMAGGEPVWTDLAGAGGWEVVNLEQIAAWNPDQIFLIVFRSDPQPVMEAIAADPTWQAMRVVQEGGLYAFPADYYGWDNPDPRWILGMTWLATRMHPDQFAGIDMMEEVYDFYGRMYGMDRAAVDEVIIPVLAGDIN